MCTKRNWLVAVVLGGILTVMAWAGDEKKPVDPANKGKTLGEQLMAQTELRERLAKIVIPKCSFQEAELQTVLTFIRKQTAELDAGGRGFNVFYQCDKAAQAQKITLDLENVPVTALLRFVCLAALAPVNFKIEEHAVVITPRTEKEPINEY